MADDSEAPAEQQDEKSFPGTHTLLIDHNVGVAHCTCSGDPLVQWNPPPTIEDQQLVRAYVEMMVRCLHTAHILGLDVTVTFPNPV